MAENRIPRSYSILELDMAINTSFSLNVGYRGEISTGDGLDSHGGSIGLNYSF